MSDIMYRKREIARESGRAIVYSEMITSLLRGTNWETANGYSPSNSEALKSQVQLLVELVDRILELDNRDTITDSIVANAALREFQQSALNNQ